MAPLLLHNKSKSEIANLGFDRRENNCSLSTTRRYQHHTVEVGVTIGRYQHYIVEAVASLGRYQYYIVEAVASLKRYQHYIVEAVALLERNHQTTVNVSLSTNKLKI